MTYRDPALAVEARLVDERAETERLEAEVAALDARVAELEKDASGLEGVMKTARGQKKSGAQHMVGGLASFAMVTFGALGGAIPDRPVRVAIALVVLTTVVVIGILGWRRDAAARKVLVEVDAELAARVRVSLPPE